MKEIPFPQYVDDPKIIGIWTFDQFAIVGIFMIGGVLIGYTWTCIGIGIISTRYIRRMREGMPDGFLLHKIWWMGLLKIEGKSFPNPFQREYIS